MIQLCAKVFPFQKAVAFYRLRSLSLYSTILTIQSYTIFAVKKAIPQIFLKFNYNWEKS